MIAIRYEKQPRQKNTIFQNPRPKTGANRPNPHPPLTSPTPRPQNGSPSPRHAGWPQLFLPLLFLPRTSQLPPRICAGRFRATTGKSPCSCREPDPPRRPNHEGQSSILANAPARRAASQLRRRAARPSRFSHLLHPLRTQTQLQKHRHRRPGPLPARPLRALWPLHSSL
jgi:hypothetical protein